MDAKQETAHNTFAPPSPMAKAAPTLLASLRERFPGRDFITRAEFRELLGISSSKDACLWKAGTYPPVVSLGHLYRIYLEALAAWLAAGGCPAPEREWLPKPGARKRGRPAGSKNKPKADAKEGLPAPIHGACDPQVRA